MSFSAIPAGYLKGTPGPLGPAGSPSISPSGAAVSFGSYQGGEPGAGYAHPGSFLPMAWYLADRGPLAREGSFSAGAPNGSASSQASSQAQPTAFAIFFTSGKGYGSASSVGGDGGAPGGSGPAGLPASGAPAQLGGPGWNASSTSGGFDTGDAHAFAWPPDAGPPGLANPAPIPLAMLAVAMKGRPEALAAVDVLGSTMGAGIPGPQAGAMVGANPETATAAVNPAAVSAANPATVAAAQGANLPGPPAMAAGQSALHAVAIDGETGAGERAIAQAFGSGRGADSRGILALRHSLDRSHGIPSETDGAAVEADPPVDGLDTAVNATRRADLIAEALPMVGDSMQRGLEEFVHQLEAGDLAGIVTQGPPPAVTATIAVVGAATSAVVVREIARRKSSRRGGRGLRIVDPFGRELALSFPELPRSWSRRY